MLLIKHLRKSKKLIGERAGIIARKISLRLFPGLSILMYHRVSNIPTDPQMLAVSPENFEEQILFLKTNYHILTLKQFEIIIKTRKTFPPRSILITFDDGYADNYFKALAILERYKVQALFFISTGHIDTLEEFWWDDLERIFLENPSLPKNNLILNLSGEHCELEIKTRFDATKAYRKLHKIIKPLTAENRKNLLRTIYLWAHLPSNGRESHRSLTRAEVKKLSDSPSAIIGAHTKNHVALSALPTDKQREEIETSKKTLEDITGKPINYFSYPFGTKKDYTKDSVALCVELDFLAAFSGFTGIARGTDERFELPRHIVRNWNARELSQHLPL